MSVVVMGVGFCGAVPTSTGLSYREMIARAASAAYDDAGITPEEVDGAVSVEEDFISGYSISDEYAPDQIGMVLKPLYTVPGDYLQGISSAAMQIETGEFKTMVVQSYCKASNVLNKDEVLTFAYDPIWNRYGVTPHYLAGIEMQHYMARTGLDAQDIAEIAATNRTAALGNPLAPYGKKYTPEDILRGRMVASPVTELMCAKHADAAVVTVLGVSGVAEEHSRHPVFISGTGWASGNSVIERRDHGASEGTVLAAKMAYDEAHIKVPSQQLDLAYVSDIYAHRQLMHMDALRLDEDFMPFVNPDGGAQAGGDLIEATSGARFYDAVRQLRGEAGAHQVEDAETALVHGWRGLPTDTAAVVILDSEGRDD